MISGDQLALWGVSSTMPPATYPRLTPMVRRNDGDTSRDAAVAVLGTVDSLRESCLKILRDAGACGLTDHELADRVKIAGIPCAGQTSAGKRRLELQRAGLVEQVIGADGKPARRPTDGATAFVWRAVRS